MEMPLVWQKFPTLERNKGFISCYKDTRWRRPSMHQQGHRCSSPTGVPEAFSETESTESTTETGFRVKETVI